MEARAIPPVPGTIAHLVLVEWRKDVADETLAELSRLVDGFRSGIPGVLSVAQGPSVSPEQLESGFDWGLVVTFADVAARDAYLPHPVHIPVAELLSRWCERVVVFDVAY